MLPGISQSGHRSSALQLAAAPATEGSLALVGTGLPGTSADLAVVDPSNQIVVSGTDLSAVTRPIAEAAKGYTITGGTRRDLAWEKAEWVYAVSTEVTRGRTEADAVQLVNIFTAGRWQKLEAKAERCVRNYRRWRDALGRASDGRALRSNWQRLIKRRGGGQIPRLDLDFMRSFYQLYLHPNAPGIKPTWRKVRGLWRLEGREDAVPSYDSVHAAVKRDVTKGLALKYRSRRNSFHHLTGGWIRRHVNAEAGTVWFMDHRECDFWVQTHTPEGKLSRARPYITAVFDARSFCCIAVLLYVDSHPNHERILETFQLAVRNAGHRLPHVIYIDNGKDFLKMGLGLPVQLSSKRPRNTLHCNAQGEPYQYSVMRALNIRVQRSRDYNGKEKPIERWFRDMAADWEKTRLGYCGNCPANRPDNTWKDDPSRLDTIGKAQASLDAWIRDEANQAPRFEGRTRAELWATRPLDFSPPIGDLDFFLRTLLPQSTTPIVRRSSMGPCGVAYAGWQYSHAALAEHFGEPLMIKTYWNAPRVQRPIPSRDKGLVTRSIPVGVFVFTLDDRLICGAVADPVHNMFAESDAERAAIGEHNHIANAIKTGFTDKFEELTGRRRIADPSRVLAKLDQAAIETTVALSVDPTPPTRRLCGETTAAQLSPPQAPRPKPTAKQRDLMRRLDDIQARKAQQVTDDSPAPLDLDLSQLGYRETH